MTYAHVFRSVPELPEVDKKNEEWNHFLKNNGFDFSSVAAIDLSGEVPQITDHEGNRFAIDFANDRQNYHKRRASMKNELISRAMGGGKCGKKILDLSAGMAQDAVFLSQLGYDVVAVERSPLLYLTLRDALERYDVGGLQIRFAEAQAYLVQAADAIDVIYFDPMFPEKNKKSALPRQEMVLFKKLVGADEDAAQVLQTALRYPGVRRVVVKRPLKAPWLADLKPQGSVAGKLIRFDIYGVAK